MTTMPRQVDVHVNLRQLRSQCSVSPTGPSPERCRIPWTRMMQMNRLPTVPCGIWAGRLMGCEGRLVVAPKSGVLIKLHGVGSSPEIAESTSSCSVSTMKFLQVQTTVFVCQHECKGLAAFGGLSRLLFVSTITVLSSASRASATDICLIVESDS